MRRFGRVRWSIRPRSAIVLSHRPAFGLGRSVLRAAGVAFFGVAACFSASLAAGPASSAPPPPRLFPDYAGIVLPPNIAPLNFRVEEPGSRYRVVFRSSRGVPIEVSNRKPVIQIPPKPWRALLLANTNEPLFFEISVQSPEGVWRQFATVTNRIAGEPIDSHLAYRLLKPLYNVFQNLGIYQRDLESFVQTPILENSSFGGNCLNCHTFLNRSPETFAFNIRLATGAAHPMMLVLSNKINHVEKTMGYLSWHPSGRLLAFSANKLSLFSHTIGETRDVFDANSDLGIYRVDSNTVLFPPSISLPDRNETWPGWSADGRHLYYNSAPPGTLDKFRRIRYDLMRVSFDIDQDKWGDPEVLVSANDCGMSACQPKASPDGKYLLFTMSAYGNFPIYQTNSDLYLMDLGTRQYRRLDINSDQADSWHSWSGNSRWVVFSSKRIDGLFARPHFSYVDAQGLFHKPFVLPQEDPSFYDTCLNTFNVPELVSGRVMARKGDLASAIIKPFTTVKPQIDPRFPTPAGLQAPASQPGYPATRE